MTELKISNIGKPVNKRWKFISKFLTRTLPIYAGAAVTLPIPEKTKVLIIFIQTVIVATISALTEMTADNSDSQPNT